MKKVSALILSAAIGFCSMGAVAALADCDLTKCHEVDGIWYCKPGACKSVIKLP